QLSPLSLPDALPIFQQRRVHPAEVGVIPHVAGVEVFRLEAGVLVTGPPLTAGPATNRHDPEPWSVPLLPFSLARRPNSENVIARDRKSTRLNSSHVA